MAAHGGRQANWPFTTLSGRWKSIVAMSVLCIEGRQWLNARPSREMVWIERRAWYLHGVFA